MSYIVLSLLSVILTFKPILVDVSKYVVAPVSELAESESLEDFDEEFKVLLEANTPTASFTELLCRLHHIVSYNSLEKIGSIFRPPIHAA